jgi:proteasome lid subunit RPN8/RPN11
MDAIRISRVHLDEMEAHAREAYPEEACGLLAGRDGEAVKVCRLRNVDASNVTFRFDPGEQIRAMKEIAREGLEIVAIYHSHPVSPPYPSQVDVARAFFPGTREPNYPGVAYVIIGLAADGPEFKAYRIAPSYIDEVSILAD